MSTTVGEVAETTRSLTTAAREIASGNTDLSQRTEEQAASLVHEILGASSAGEQPPALACQLAAMCAANPRHRARQPPLR
jgi:hypothetical protein